MEDPHPTPQPPKSMPQIRETRRDKRLVRQAETEMRGDKKFLVSLAGSRVESQYQGLENLDWIEQDQASRRNPEP